MSVERMKIMGIIGKKMFLDKTLRLVVLNKSMHLINALARVNSTDFFLAPTERNIAALEEEAFLKPCSQKRDFNKDEEMVRLLQNLFNIKPEIKKEYLKQDYDYQQFMRQFEDIYQKVKHTADEITEKERLIANKKEYINNLKYLSAFPDLNMNRLISMQYLSFKLIRISRDNYDKLKKNYENIPAVILKIAVEGKQIIVASFVPQTLEETVEKIFSSLNYTTLAVPEKIEGNVAEIIEQLSQNIEEDLLEIENRKKSLENFREKYGKELQKGYSRLEMEKLIEEIKPEIAVGDNLFFLFGFVPTGDITQLKNELEQHFSDQLIILVDEAKQPGSGITPPTKLKNMRLFSPFESLVKMYGTPDYQEKDPTAFFAITYMILFGAMFGDVGQGLVLFIIGIFLEFTFKKGGMAGILSRIGFSSAIFGLFYGSVFGSEEIISPLVINPMANINNMLIISVIFGIILMLSGYIFNMINSSYEKNIEEGLLGRNGLVGLSFYLLLLFSAYQAFVAHQEVKTAYVFTLLALLVLMLFKVPISRKMLPGDNSSLIFSINDYIEEGFGVLETLLSMLSNTISFLRVGAFALNHVGLYIAFLTLSEMIKSSMGSWAILILGNIIILTLEALIVFIQALRLEYYELFTKYYRGTGIEYTPAKMNHNINL
ncbi:MAG: V-type ATPase 116kDa subunit family protein [Atribacterota bacterium]|nr:V-type ATPase 116kDa subunit family protein [Atribacterota bacterium]